MAERGKRGVPSSRAAAWTAALLLAGLVAPAAVWAQGAAPGTLRLLVNNSAGTPLADAVVMLEPTGSARPAARPPAPAEVVQQDKQFRPTVSVVAVGARVDFPNRDTVRHHLFSFSEAKKFEIKLYVGKPSIPVVFDRAGVVVLGCNIHDSMLGWIVVTDAPWFGTTAAGGRAQLSDVPAGAYRLRVWHPVLGAGHAGHTQTVNLPAPAELSLRLPGGSG